MKKVYLLLLLFVISVTSFSQNVENEDVIGIDDYEIVDGTYSYRSPNTNGGVGSFFDRTSNWSSSEYLEGHLKQVSTDQFRMNFRYLQPQGYDATYGEGYPLILMLHGAVERANCYNNQCYSHNLAPGTSYRPWNLPPEGITDPNRRNLLNNDHQLLNGGAAHRTAWNLAGTKKPDDPTLNPRGFPGFIVFPQMLNGWHPTTPGQVGSGTDIYDAIRIVRLMINKYNIDPDRIYIHGLSEGGKGVMAAVVYADWLFAAAAPMSPIPNGTSHSYYWNSLNNGAAIGSSPASNPPDIQSVPIWFFQGGKDGNPRPSITEYTVTQLRADGASVRYSLYPNLGHGVWNTAYAEPDFFSWLLSKRKSDIHVQFDMPRVCASSGAGVRLFLPREMRAFQWEKDGEIIPNADDYMYVATEPGVYRARFSRVSSDPTEEQWNRWSRPVEITSSAPPVPEITHSKSVVLTDLNGSNTTDLNATPGYTRYTWHRASSLNNGSSWSGQASVSGQVAATLTAVRPCADESCAHLYRYNVRAYEFDGCYSISANKNVFFDDTAPYTIVTPTGFVAEVNNNTNVLLRWNDDSNNERNYEIWRRRSTEGAAQWTLVTITPEDAVLYLDQNLVQGATYYYKIRAVSDLSRSHYAPSDNPAGNSASDHLIVTLNSDVIPPSIPQNLSAQIIDTDISTQTCSIRISWDASTDAYGVMEYVVNFDGDISNVQAPVTSDTITGVPINDNIPFTVRARDLNNNISSTSSQVNIDTRIEGLYWIHSTTFYTDLTQIPPYKWEDREYSGKTPNVDIGLASQDSYLLMKFYGYLYVSTAGNYNFRIHHNDGVNFFLDGDSIIYYNNYVDQDSVTSEINVAGANTFLSAGLHTVELRYWQSEDDKALSWEWQGFDAGPDADEWYPIPDDRLKSFDNFDPPPVPATPIDLTALGSDMDEITLSWNYSGDAADIEVWRSPDGVTGWQMIERVNDAPFIDTGLLPVTTYHYRIRSVNQYGVSPFSETVPGTTLDDEVAPTAPTNLIAFSNTLSSISLGWTASTDNLGVTRYEIWVNGAYHSQTPNTYAIISGLTPQTTPSIYVIAFDAKNNQSPPSNTIEVPLTGVEIFYSKSGSGALNSVGQWGKEPDGTGVQPVNFNTNGYYFVLTRASASVSNWTVNGSVSKIIISAGTSLSATSALSGNVEIQGDGRLVLQSNTQPTLASVSPTSTVVYSFNGTQTVQPGNYGKLELRGSGTKVFPTGITTINGNLEVDAGVAISGAENNASTVIVHGDIIFSGTPLFSSSSRAVRLELLKPGIQTIAFSGTLDLFHLVLGSTTQTTINNLGSSATLSLGSSQGGGLTIPTGASLFLQGNTLRISGAGAVNGAGETGRIFSTGGSIDISSSSNLSSNLFFDPPNRLLTNLSTQMTGSGVVRLQTPVHVTDAIRVRAGDLVSNGNLTMLSTPLKTANLRTIETNGRVVGLVHVQRYFSLKNKMYRYLSSPVEGATVNLWKQYFSITGDFLGAPGTSPSIYTLDFKGDWVGYPDKDFLAPYNTLNAPLDKGRGYAVYVRNTNPFTVDYAGNPFQGAVNYAVFAPDADFDGWNLIGNPYASTIRWSNDPAAWTKNASISSIVAVRNNVTSTTGQFVYYDADTQLGTNNGMGGDLIDGMIAPGQAFYVRATAASPEIAIHEPAKHNDQQTFFRERSSSEISHLYVNLNKGEMRDQAVLIFTEKGADEFEMNRDALKMKNGGVFNFSSLTADGKSAAINHMTNVFCSKSVWLNIDNPGAGEYRLEIPDPLTLHGIKSITLKDNFEGKTLEVGHDFEYSFTVNAEPGSFGSERFELILNRQDLASDVVVQSENNCYGLSHVRLENTQKGVFYSIVNSEGVEISRQLSTGAKLDFEVAPSLLRDGVNTFMVVASFGECATLTLPATASITYYHAPMLGLGGNEVMVCAGSSAKLEVSGANESIVSYKWYDGENALIKGNNSAQAETAPVVEESFYSVSAVLKNGCETPRYGFVVLPVEMVEPDLVFVNDTLFVSVQAEQYEWIQGGKTIKSGSEPFLAGIVNGEYQIVCKTGGCDKTSKVFSVTSTQPIAEMDVRYELFPNPTSGRGVNLRVFTSDPTPMMVKVIDILGREHYTAIFDHNALRNSVRITPTNAFGSGVYYLIVQQGSRVRELKFVVK